MKQSEESKSYHCPVCNSALNPGDVPYGIDDLFKLWAPIQFRSETIEEHRKQSEYTQMYLCPKCELTIYFPQIIGTANFYHDLLRYESHYFYSKEKWDFDVALSDAQQCSSVIELGCGVGNFLENLEKRVPVVYGTEYNDTAIEIARSKGLIVFGKDHPGMEQLRGTFDAAFSFHVLEHVADPVEFIKDMFAWVKPDGKVGISVPNMDGPLKYINPCMSNMPPHHATRWKLQTFRVLAKQFGYKIERVAFEPLSSEYQSYYSLYWANHFLPGDSLLMKFIRLLINKFLNVGFHVLNFFGKNTIKLLKGQSIYILLSKNS